ncbi:hypothetical protein SAMN02745938_11179 [Flavobacterium psychrophilum DSM 3660]|uniref:hypothetical protein n=1 Tax=Flavobacterium psychrophilum TaxID=96345 RepID=UPI0004F64DED|nr:hypothetical protein [Flavobacterium psychrophilum]AIN75116.1 hypothetical protein FPG3_05225 [Flavobacterium psychrophilum FPG3]MBF2043685.1 hypothetical protein [Flavobacterium psychrophilum]OXB15018.1 hypothetical protein B0A57_01155 [Flavobacterium psychrophilum DSM 3660 = ATCC 49418]SCY23132.1 hypothetical protein SAMN02745938_11179 [Flavobacterium psychrophilum DSM 3660] [Flavobacterium psychrophilum DSM 3660 = ATCC 49418]
MKRLLQIMIIIFSVSAYTQERVNAVLPKISATVSSKLTIATGWLKNEDGQWISRKNRIPFKIENKFKQLIDYEKYALGENGENFISYELRDININDSIYCILIKRYNDGYYKYESINEGWTKNQSIDYHVFLKSELEKFKSIKNDTINNLEIPVLYNNTFRYVNTTTFSNTDISKDISKQMLTGKVTEPFLQESIVFNIKIYKSNVRFLVTEGIDESNRSYQRAEDLEDYYYESTMPIFNQFIVLK